MSCACSDKRAEARSPALALAEASAASTCRRMRPHRSISQFATSEALRWVMIRPAVVPPTRPVGERLRVIEASASSVGKSGARAALMAACAWRNCASEAARLWLETSIFSTSALSSASPKISHHWPRAISSRGSASFQPPGGAAGEQEEQCEEPFHAALASRVLMRESWLLNRSRYK